MLALLRHRWPETPVVVMIEEFTSDLAARAFGMGAKDVLQKPVEAKNVKACLRELPPAQDYSSPMMAKLREKIHGESASLLAALWQLTRVIPHADSNVLLLGESGTGKELFARAIHELGPRHGAPFRGDAGLRHPRAFIRKRDVRPRKGRVHERGQTTHRSFRTGRRRNALPRRDRRPLGLGADQAAARDSGEEVSAFERQRRTALQGEAGMRHASRPARRGQIIKNFASTCISASMRRPFMRRRCGKEKETLNYWPGIFWTRTRASDRRPSPMKRSRYFVATPSPATSVNWKTSSSRRSEAVSAR